MTDERKIREIYGVKSVLDEAAERIEATWREKLLRETGDLRTENALLRAQLDEFNRKLVEARDRNERLEADCNERVAFIEEKLNSIPRASSSRTTSFMPRASDTSPMPGSSTGRSSSSMSRPWPWSMRSSACAASVTPR